MKRTFIISTLILSFFMFVWEMDGQVGIGTLTPNSKSALDVVSTTSGFLIPRMTQAQRNAITTPPVGLQIYQTDNTPGFYYYDGSSWVGQGNGTVTLINTGTGITGGPFTGSGTVSLATMAARTVKGNISVSPAVPTDISFGTTVNTVALGDHTHAVPGADKQMIFNNSGALNGSSNLRWNNTYKHATIGNLPDNSIYNNLTAGSGLRISNYGTYSGGATCGLSNITLTSNLLFDNGRSNYLYFLRSKDEANAGGTVGRVLNADRLGGLTWFGWNNYFTGVDLNWGPQFGASIDVFVDGTVSDDIMPTTMNLQATKNITLSADAAITFTAPSIVASKLEVAGQIKINGGTPGSGKVLTSDATGLATWTAPGTASWSLTGNAGTTPGTQFIGTTDNINLMFKANSLQCGLVDISHLNASFGYRSLISNTTGNNNTAFGSSASYSNLTGGGNTAVGSNALNANITSGITAIGNAALLSNTTGSANTGVGNQVMALNTAGNYNTAIGVNAAYSNQIKSNNTAIGYVALYTNTGGDGNTAMGSQSLQLSTTGSYNTSMGFASMMSNLTGSNNVATGILALRNNTGGSNNTANGNSALLSNTTGLFNTAIGAFALYSNLAGFENTATGDSALYFNTGDGNAAFGHAAMKSNTSGVWNVAQGGQAMFYNTTGNYNSAIGVNALKKNSVGTNNTALGNAALFNNTTGSNNTALGANADVSSGDFTNATAIGYGAVALGSNYIRIGNGNVGTIGGNVGWSNLSDKRWKENISDVSSGLELIKKLRPVQYQMINLADRRINWGFLAQDVEQIVGSDNAIITVGNDESRTLGLRYSDFIAPMVKAMQEQQSIIEQQNLKIETLQKAVESQRQEMEEIKKKIGM